MSANYIADFDSRPDAEYVGRDDKDYLDSEWQARVSYDPPVRDESREGFGAFASSDEVVLIVVNTVTRRVTVKHLGETRSKVFGSVGAATQAGRDWRDWCHKRGLRSRIWFPEAKARVAA